MARDPQIGGWSPVAFLKANQASLGFQFGAEENYFAILLMSANAPRFLTEPNFEFDGDACGTAGDVSVGVSGAMADAERPMLVYSSRQGLYGGVALKGGAVSPDEQAHRSYYGQFVTMKDIFHKLRPTPAAAYPVIHHLRPTEIDITCRGNLLWGNQCKKSSRTAMPSCRWNAC